MQYLWSNLQFLALSCSGMLHFGLLFLQSRINPLSMLASHDGEACWQWSPLELWLLSVYRLTILQKQSIFTHPHHYHLYPKFTCIYLCPFCFRNWQWRAAKWWWHCRDTKEYGNHKIRWEGDFWAPAVSSLQKYKICSITVSNHIRNHVTNFKRV